MDSSSSKAVLRSALAFFLFVAPVFASSLGTRDVSFDRELLYIQRLQQAGLHDYADLVIEETRQRHPEVEARIKALELKGLLARGRFEEARARIRQEPDPNSAATWAMKLALGDAYYSFGRYEEADQIYQSFFARYPQGPPPELNTFYRDAAYTYAQMLLYTGREEKALEAYRLVLKSDLKSNEKRQMYAEMGELMLKLAQKSEGKKREALLTEARKRADDLLWVRDIWFGKGIVLLAHLNMLRGDLSRAQELVEEYMPQLRSIDEALRKQAEEVGQDLSRISPMAECRYLLGVMLQEEAERLLQIEPVDREKVLSLLIGEKMKDGTRRSTGALHHFVNVFVRYPDTQWAAECGRRADAVESILTEKFGAKIRKAITPEQWARVRRNLFKEARILFSRNRFSEAAEQYIVVLNQFPNAEETIPALGELARAYIEEGELLFAETVAGHLAERYGGHSELQKPAGDEVLRLARFFEERGFRTESRRLYEKFFKFHEEHPLAPATLYRFGEDRFRAENYREALPYFQAVANAYSNSPLRYSSLNRIATIYERRNALTNEIAALETYVDALSHRERPGEEAVHARFRMARAVQKLAVQQLRSGDEASEREGNALLARAARHYNELIEMLNDSGGTDGGAPPDREANRKIREASRFSIGLCLMMLTRPEERRDAFKRAAIETFETLLREAPDSEYAPRALSRTATLWTILESPEKAQAALERLRRDYPNSQEARNALFTMGRNLLDMGLRNEAAEAFRRMFREGGDYTPAQRIAAGEELLAIDEIELALRAFETALAEAGEDDVAVLAPALLGKARALFERGDNPEAVAVLETFLQKFPSINRTMDALLLQSRAARAAGEQEPDAEKRSRFFKRAEDALQALRRRRETPRELFEIDLEVARLLAARARAEQKFGTSDSREKIREQLGMAVAAYLQITLNADPDDLNLSDLLQNAYYESIPLMIQLEDWENVRTDCQTYLEDFPQGRYNAEIRTWMNQARVESGAAGTANTPSAP